MRLKRRNWGVWAIMFQRKHFKIKLLRFKKGGALSMQKHQLRNELWLFLKGGGILEVERQFKKRSKGDSENIPVNNWHQFSAEKATWILEIQYGIMCSEKDIERKNAK